MAYEPLDRSCRMVVTTAAGVQVAEPGTEPTSLDLETGSLFGFGSDWMTVEPHETSTDWQKQVQDSSEGQPQWKIGLVGLETQEMWL